GPPPTAAARACRARFQAEQPAAHAEEPQCTRSGGRPAACSLPGKARLEGEDVLVVAPVVAAEANRTAPGARPWPWPRGSAAGNVGAVHHQVVAEGKRKRLRQPHPRRRSGEPAPIVAAPAADPVTPAV